MTRRVAYGMLMLACTAGGAPACSDAPPVTAETDPVTVRDSAGIEIVENARPLWEAGDAWFVDSIPTLQIGAIEGEAAYQFARPTHATRSPDGWYAVAERQTREVRIFDAEGIHVTTFGGAGEGPGRFQEGPFIAAPESDTIVTWDPRGMRLTWFGMDGTVLREVSVLAPAAEAGLRPVGAGSDRRVRADGVVVTSQTGFGGLMDGGIGERTADPYLVTGPGEVVFSPGPVVRSRSMSLPGPEGGNYGFSDPFGPRAFTTLGLGPFPLIVGQGPPYEIHHFALDGSLARIVRARIPAIVVTDAIRADERRELVENARALELDGAAAGALFDRLPRSDTLHRLGPMLSDRVGNLWVERSTLEAGLDRPRDFDVFGPDGRWLGMVPVPRALGGIEEIGDDYLIAVWRGELDVPYVRVYPLVKGAG